MVKDNQVYSKVKTIVCNILMYKELKVNGDTIVNPEEKIMHAYDEVKLNLALEDAFEIRIPEHQMEVCRTLNDFVELVETRIQLGEKPR